VHIKDELNAVADSLSRNLPVPAEWTLNDQSFQWVVSLGSAPQVGLSVSVSSSQGSPDGNRLSTSLQGKSHSHSFMVASSILVSNSIEMVFQLEGVSQSSPIVTGLM